MQLQFNRHTNLQGLHAPFSASKSSWLKYDDEKAIEVYLNMQAKTMGTRLHEWAQETIKLRLKQPRSKKTIYAYVNDAIGYKMETEVVLFYSENFFGTADAILFKDGLLRIHDLKTGKLPADMQQLEVYAALFCLEYRVDPRKIEIELRIYQNDTVFYHNPSPEKIQEHMDTIVHLDKVITKIQNEEV